MYFWTESETKLLKEQYNKVVNSELVKLFPNRTPLSIYKKARKLGLYKSDEIKFKNRSLSKSGNKASNWKGGRKINKKGYVLRLCPNHHRADKNGYVLEHILIFEEATGIDVPEECVIHHLNGIKTDNRIENLCMMERGAHSIFHHLGKKRSEEARKNISEGRKRKHE